MQFVVPWSVSPDLDHKQDEREIPAPMTWASLLANRTGMRFAGCAYFMSMLRISRDSALLCSLLTMLAPSFTLNILAGEVGEIGGEG